MGNIVTDYEDPDYVADKVEHMGNGYVDEDHLLGLSADSTHFSQEHHQENNDAYNISFNIEKCIIQYHTAIIDR